MRAGSFASVFFLHFFAAEVKIFPEHGASGITGKEGGIDMAQMSVQTQLAAVPKEAVSITASQLRKLKNCGKEYYLAEIGLRLEGWQEKEWLDRCLAEIRIAAVSGRSVTEQHEVIDVNASYFYEEWFSCRTEADAAREKAVQLLHRFVDYLGQYTVCAADKTYQFPVSPIEYRGVRLRTIRGRIDFLLKDAAGTYHAVVVRCGKPQESYRARKQLNLPEYSLDLVHTYMGGRSLFREQFIPEIWYLSNKDDTGTALIERFEHREGKNIIRFDFSTWTEENLVAGWRRALSGPQECDCGSCRYSGICHIDEHLRLDEGVKKEAVPAVAREKTFTPAQESVIRHVGGPMCAVAVPGSGKTTALCERVVNLVKNKYAKASEILLVTFTRKAAREMSERIGERFRACHIKGMPHVVTYHALGFSILKENPMYLGQSVLATDTDRQALIYDLWKSLPKIEGLSTYDPCGSYGAVRTLDKMFHELEEGMTEDVFEKRHAKYDCMAVRQAYVQFQRLYKEKHYISFDDQITLVNKLFDQFPTLSEHYAKKYPYIMIDEFQDSSEDQVDMIYAIARHHNNLVVVGDDDQSIYGFRGGSPRFMMEFAFDFSGAKTIYMQDNFRSNKGVADVCNAIISEPSVQMRYDKLLIAHRGQRFRPVYARGADATFVGSLILQAMAAGIRPGSIAVLTRSNKRLEEVSCAFDPSIPVSLAKDYLVEDDVFRGIYDLLALYYDGMDDQVLYRTMQRMGAGECKKSDRTISLYEDLSNQNNQVYQRVFNEIRQCFSDIKSVEMREALRRILDTLYGKQEHLVLDALFELSDTRAIVRMKDLYGVLSDMVRFHSMERVGYDVDPDSVSLLTCHDAKGMEFDFVIVYGVEDFDVEQEEEVRVLYVAASRAKETLYLVETGSPLQYGGFDRLVPYMQVVGS